MTPKLSHGTLVVSTNGGPGAGKSTSAAHLFALLKWRGYDAELVTEYAKGKTYEGAPEVTLANQIKVFGKQHDYLTRCLGGCDVVVTDASLVNSLVYGDTSETFKAFVLDEVRGMGGLHFFIERRKAYNPRGRAQTEAEARALDDRILDAFDDHDIPYEPIVGGEDVAFRMLERVLEVLDTYRADAVPADVTGDHNGVSVEFDAGPFFDQVAPRLAGSIAYHDWRTSYERDQVAEWFIDGPVAGFFASGAHNDGWECHVDVAAAMRRMAARNPEAFVWAYAAMASGEHLARHDLPEFPDDLVEQAVALARDPAFEFSAGVDFVHP